MLKLRTVAVAAVAALLCTRARVRRHRTQECEYGQPRIDRVALRPRERDAHRRRHDRNRKRKRANRRPPYPGHDCNVAGKAPGKSLCVHKTSDRFSR